MITVAHDDRRPDAPDPADPERRADPEPDFAEEHDTPSHADQQPGGPERSPEPESPEGLAGMDP